MAGHAEGDALDGIPLWSYVTYTQNIFMGLDNTQGPGWLAVTWSLAVEEQFYLVFPVLIWVVSRRNLPFVFLWFIATAIYLRYSLPGLSAYINTPWRADSLMTGALLAYAMRTPVFNAFVARSRIALLVLLLLFAVGISTANHHGMLVLGGAVTHASLAMLYGLLILYVLAYRNGLLARIMRNNVLMWLGTISYGVYLFHTGISGLLHALIRHSRPYMATWSGCLVTLLALLLTLLLAHASYYYFEKRILRIGHRFKYE